MQPLDSVLRPPELEGELPDDRKLRRRNRVRFREVGDDCLEVAGIEAGHAGVEAPALRLRELNSQQVLEAVKIERLDRDAA